MDNEERQRLINVLRDIQKKYFNECEKQWYQYFDKAIEELEYEK